VNEPHPRLLPYTDHEREEETANSNENGTGHDGRMGHENSQWPESRHWGQDNLIGVDDDTVERGLGVHPSGLGRPADG
jgi:hypothetical protein